MHIVNLMFTLHDELVGEDGKEYEDDSDEDSKDESRVGGDHGGAKDFDAKSKAAMQEVSVASSKRPRSKARQHKNQASRDVPTVSDYVKYARSTFVMKSANNKQQLPDMMMNQRQDAEQQAMFDVTNKAKRQLKRVETIVSK